MASMANAAWRARALQKSSGAADLRGECGTPPFQPPPRPRPLLADTASRNETEEAAPIRHAPRLTAAFTAQLLGQILPDPERRSAPGYGGAQPPLIFDTQL
jgi:hypothetical protein